MSEPMQDALQSAIAFANMSPCRKSKRGVAIYTDKGVTLGLGYNHRPDGVACDGSEACRRDCAKICVHAEQAALLAANNREHIGEVVELVHIKTVDGAPVLSGGPSCAECSKIILASGIDFVWLLEGAGWRRYSSTEFHATTLRACGLYEGAR